MARSTENRCREHPSLSLLGVVVCSLAACSANRVTTNTPRTALQQLLVTEAADRALEQVAWPRLGGESVFVETVSSGTPEDEDYVRAVASAELGRRGAAVVEERKCADLVATVVAASLGTEQLETLVGVPAMQSAFIPIPFPEIGLYKSVRQEGFAKTELFLKDAARGDLLAHSGPTQGETYAATYKILLVNLHRTDTSKGDPPDPLYGEPRDPSGSDLLDR